jgi:hypothetical protein
MVVFTGVSALGTGAAEEADIVNSSAAEPLRPTHAKSWRNVICNWQRGDILIGRLQREVAEDRFWKIEAQLVLWKITVCV